MRRALAATALGALLLAGTACDGFGRGAVDNSTLDVAVANPTYEEHIAPMMAAHCTECHGPEAAFGAPSNLHLDTYEGLVEAAEISVDRMLDSPSRPMPPFDRPPTNDAEQETFANWVGLGMPRSGS